MHFFMRPGQDVIWPAWDMITGLDLAELLCTEREIKIKGESDKDKDKERESPKKEFTYSVHNKHNMCY